MWKIVDKNRQLRQKLRPWETELFRSISKASLTRSMVNFESYFQKSASAKIKILRAKKSGKCFSEFCV